MAPAGREDAPGAIHGRNFTIRTVEGELVIASDMDSLKFESGDTKESVVRSDQGQKIHVQPTQPENPSENDIWIDTS